MPYGYILWIAVTGLCAVFIFATEARTWAKAVVIALLGVSFLWRYGFLVQSALGVTVSLYFTYLKARSRS